MEIIRTTPYLKSVKKIGITAEDEVKLFEELRINPEKGDVIVGSGGARKTRLALGNRGKSKGARVIYHYIKLKEKIYLLGVYLKSEQANLTKAQINELKQLNEIIERL